MTRFSLQGDASWLRKKWQDTIDLYRECLKDERKGAERFASKVGAIIEEVEEMLSEQPKGNDNSVTTKEYSSGGPGVLFEEAMLGRLLPTNKQTSKQTHKNHSEIIIIEVFQEMQYHKSRE